MTMRKITDMWAYVVARQRWMLKQGNRLRHLASHEQVCALSVCLCVCLLVCHWIACRYCCSINSYFSTVL